MGGGWRGHGSIPGRTRRPPLRKRSCYDSIFIQLGDEILQLGVDRMRLCGYFVVVLIGVLVSIPVTARKSKARKGGTTAPGQAEIERMTARFAPTQLRVDISKLSAGDRQALAKIIEAARILNDIFMKQYWSGDTALYARLQKDSSALGKARLHYFWINKGPWSALEEFKAFVPGVPARKPEGANFYPVDMTKQQFESWLASLTPEQQAAAKGFFTVIRWNSGNGSSAQRELTAIPYNQEYKDDLTRAAGLLKEAADLTENASLKKFLSSRADAFLSNDDRVVQQKGSKRVMLRNIQEAKFRTVLLPIARRTLSKHAMVDVNFESFFTHIVAHELMHGLGPHQIKVQGRDTTPREELKELYSGIEEAKADVTGLFALDYMMEHAKEMGLTRVLPSDEAAQRQLYMTYLASMFRSLRFGLTDAHGKGMAIQFNYLLDKDAFTQNPDGTFAVNVEKFKQGVRELDHDLLTIEAEGDYAGAKKLQDEPGVLRPVLRSALDNLQGIPTDIEPIFVTADEVVAPSKSQPDRKNHRRR